MENKILSVSLSKTHYDFNYNGIQTAYGREMIYWGCDNLFPYHLQELMQSSIHYAILKTKVDMIVGEGFIYESESNILNKFITKDILQKLAWDLVLYGGYALKINYSVDRTIISNVSHIDFSHCRVNADITKVWYKDFLNSTSGKPEILPVWGEAEPELYPVQVLYYTVYTPGSIVYPRADYFGCLNYIQIDQALGEFHLNNVENGFFPSAIISMNNQAVRQDQVEEFNDSLNKFATGGKNAGKVFTIVLNGEKTVQVDSFEASHNVDLFNSLNEITQQKIISGHRLPSPVLAGISGSGGLGGNANEISVSNEMFGNTVIIPFQNQILFSVKKIMKFNKDETDSLTIGTSRPIQYILSESALMQILTEDELRALIGYEPKNNQLV